MTEVLDLDVLRPEPRKVKIGGKEIDASYVPIAITWEVDELVNELMKYQDVEKLRNDGKTARDVLRLGCRLCAVFSSWQHKELTAEWFEKNADAQQIFQFVEVIKGTLERAYNGVEAYQGNAEASQPDR